MEPGLRMKTTCFPSGFRIMVRLDGPNAPKQFWADVENNAGKDGLTF
jgi:hypothetical protein